LRDEGRIYFGADGNSQPNTIRYLSEVDGVVPWTWLPHEEVGNTDIAKKEIYTIFGKDVDFPTPKPTSLIERILQIATNKDSIILDSFAGSGSTAHAVLNLNKADNGNRKFILVELMDYADNITAERVRKVAVGYEYKGKEEVEIYSQPLTLSNIVNASKYIDEAKAVREENLAKYTKVGTPKLIDNCIKVKATTIIDEKIDGIGGQFDFYELGEPIFNANGEINPDIEEDKIRAYVFYTETRSNLIRERLDTSKYLLDTIDGVGYYFYYEKDDYTTLSKSTLGKVVTEKAEQYIIYANCCTLSKETLTKYNIVFKKISSEIKRF
jgi:adenine-specific DNA-methyltransferase